MLAKIYSQQYNVSNYKLLYINIYIVDIYIVDIYIYSRHIYILNIKWNFIIKLLFMLIMLIFVLGIS